MPRATMCDYGNCTRDVHDGSYLVRLTITTNLTKTLAARPAFCCVQHAAAWLASRHNVYAEPGQDARSESFQAGAERQIAADEETRRQAWSEVAKREGAGASVAELAASVRALLSIVQRVLSGGAPVGAWVEDQDSAARAASLLKRLEE